MGVVLRSSPLSPDVFFEYLELDRAAHEDRCLQDPQSGESAGSQPVGSEAVRARLFRHRRLETSLAVVRSVGEETSSMNEISSSVAGLSPSSPAASKSLPREASESARRIAFAYLALCTTSTDSRESIANATSLA